MTPQNPDLPGGCTQRDCDGGVIKQPSDDQIHEYVCNNWRSLLHEHIGFEGAEVDDNSHDTDDEQTYVFITVRAPVSWFDLE